MNVQFIPHKLIEDNCGDWYLVPLSRLDEFKQDHTLVIYETQREDEDHEGAIEAKWRVFKVNEFDPDSWPTLYLAQEDLSLTSTDGKANNKGGEEST